MGEMRGSRASLPPIASSIWERDLEMGRQKLEELPVTFVYCTRVSHGSLPAILQPKFLNKWLVSIPHLISYSVGVCVSYFLPHYFPPAFPLCNIHVADVEINVKYEDVGQSHPNPKLCLPHHTFPCGTIIVDILWGEETCPDTSIFLTNARPFNSSPLFWTSFIFLWNFSHVV